MDKLTIITNHVPRNMKYGYEMPEKIKSDFDYIDKDDFDTHDFFVYRGRWYDPSEFMRCDGNDALKGWDGYSSDSYFSGILIKYTSDMEQVIVGMYLS